MACICGWHRENPFIRALSACSSYIVHIYIVPICCIFHIQHAKQTANEWKNEHIHSRVHNNHTHTTQHTNMRVSVRRRRGDPRRRSLAWHLHRVARLVVCRVYGRSDLSLSAIGHPRVVRSSIRRSHRGRWFRARLALCCRAELQSFHDSTHTKPPIDVSVGVVVTPMLLWKCAFVQRSQLSSGVPPWRASWAREI